MKRVLVVLFATAFLLACQSPKFLVVKKQSVDSTENCIVKLQPLNNSANLNDIRDALVSCEEYNIGDTLILTRKTFTNW